MLLPIHLKTDWARTQQCKQDIVNVNNKKENLKRVENGTVLVKKSYWKNQD
jgi:hypothetical protein